MSGRPVPWTCWAEWEALRADLWSEDPNRQLAGLQQVCAWRLRGKLPLGVDATAHLMDARRADEDWQRAVAWAAAAAAASRPCQASAADAEAALAAGELPLRLRYSLPLIRLVNGISDSQQRGRVASSVAVLSDAAGLPRALVDVRHEASHNDLPSLPLLRAAADSALAWLRENYWDGQSQALAAASTRIAALLTCLAESWRAAAAAGFIGGGAAAAADKDDSEEEWDAEAAGTTSYSGAEGQRVRRQALSDLRSLLPPAFTHELLAPLLECPGLRPPEPPGQQRASQHPRQPGQQGGPPPPQQQQQQVEELAWRSVLKQLIQWYPRLRLLLLQAALQRLSSMAAVLDACAQGGSPTDGGAAAADEAQRAQLYMRWALRLLPAGAVASQQPPSAAQGPALSSPNRRAQQGRSAKKAAPAAAAAASAGRRQQAGGGGGACGDGAGEPSLDGPLSAEQLEALLSTAVEGGGGSRCGVGGPSLAAGAGAPPSDANEGRFVAVAASEATGPAQCLQVVVDVLQRALALVGPGRGAKRRRAAAEEAEGEPGAQGGGAGGGAGTDSRVHPLSLPTGEGGADADAAGDNAAAALDTGDALHRGEQTPGCADGRPQRQQQRQEHLEQQQMKQPRPPGPPQRRWQRCEDWARCAIGCLPCSLNPNGRLPQLTAPPPPLPPPTCAGAGVGEAPDGGAAAAAAAAATFGPPGLAAADVSGAGHAGAWAGPEAVGLAAAKPVAGQAPWGAEVEMDIAPYESPPPQYGGVVHCGSNEDEGADGDGVSRGAGSTLPDEGAGQSDAPPAGGAGLFGVLLQQRAAPEGPVSGVGFLL